MLADYLRVPSVILSPAGAARGAVKKGIFFVRQALEVRLASVADRPVPASRSISANVTTTLQSSRSSARPQSGLASRSSILRGARLLNRCCCRLLDQPGYNPKRTKIAFPPSTCQVSLGFVDNTGAPRGESRTVTLTPGLR
jgi:hypothetical protein